MREVNGTTIRLKPYKEVYRQNRDHKGLWLTLDVAREYAARSRIYRAENGNQYSGKVREIGEELRKLYGLTDIEARNILFGQNVVDYVNKYNRIRNMIPVGIVQNDHDDGMAVHSMAG
ncbi:MAG: hypothetical protein K6E63_05760 [Lachnospiraceae bacterium]|nr:hypothetical protein [Lachnospiraceae bacterium]